MTLAVIQTHPVQYSAPIYRHLSEQLGVSLRVIYGSDFSVAGYRDAEFARTVAWDVDLTAGYPHEFLGHGPLGSLSARGLRNALERIAPRAVLLTGYHPTFNMLSVIHARRSRRPLLMRSEASDVSHARHRLKAAVRDRVLRRVYRHISQFLYVGRNALEHYRRLGVSEERLCFSPLSVSARGFAPVSSSAALRAEVRAALGATNSDCVVLFSGKLIAKKAPEQLLQAARALPEPARRRLTVVFMGDGPLRRRLEALARACAMPRVRLLGFKNQSQLSGYYHACDLLALPSVERETWGLVVNEALMHGKPCLVSDRVGCAPDLVEPGVTGHVHRHDDVDDLARALLLTMELAARGETARRCLDRVSGYSTARSAEGIRDAYRRVAAGGT